MFNAENYILSSYGEALEALSTLQDQMDTFGELTIADFKDAVGYSTNMHSQDYDYGWTDISEVTIEETIGGFYIDMPTYFKF